MAQQTKNKILIVTDDRFYADPHAQAIEEKFNNVPDMVSSKTAYDMMPQELQSYAAVLQLSPSKVPQIFSDSSQEGVDASVTLLKSLRMKAPKLPILCAPVSFDADINGMQLKLDSQNIRFVALEAVSPKYLAERLKYAIDQPMGRWE